MWGMRGLDGGNVPDDEYDSGQPIVISEYSFHSLDGRSGESGMWWDFRRRCRTSRRGRMDIACDDAAGAACHILWGRLVSVVR